MAKVKHKILSETGKTLARALGKTLSKTLGNTEWEFTIVCYIPHVSNNENNVSC